MRPFLKSDLLHSGSLAVWRMEQERMIRRSHIQRHIAGLTKTLSSYTGPSATVNHSLERALSAGKSLHQQMQTATKPKHRWQKNDTARNLTSHPVLSSLTGR